MTARKHLAASSTATYDEVRAEIGELAVPAA